MRTVQLLLLYVGRENLKLISRHISAVEVPSSEQNLVGGVQLSQKLSTTVLNTNQMMNCLVKKEPEPHTVCQSSSPLPTKIHLKRRFLSFF